MKVPAATLAEVNVPGTFPLRSVAVDLDDHGYVETEYYASGTAGRYRGAQPGLLDTAELIDDGYPYRTRVLVRRPADPRDFNGTVVLEWSNVTVGQDINFTFAESYEYLLPRATPTPRSRRRSWVSRRCGRGTPNGTATCP